MYQYIVKVNQVVNKIFKTLISIKEGGDDESRHIAASDYEEAAGP